MRNILIPIPVLSELSQTIKLPHSNFAYSFTFFDKLDISNSGIAFIKYYKNGASDKIRNISIENSFWTKYTFGDTLSTLNDYSITVQFMGGYSDFGRWKLLIDICILNVE